MNEIIMIGNTHFDPVWLWRWDEALSSVTATFRSALERMKEDEDFCYSFSAPAVLEQIRLTDAELFEEIKQRVLEGRWELAEGWWLQADCYGAMGESYVRQGLYAQRYFMKHFGMKSETVFNVDSFGHCEALPQILEKSGIKNYVFWRPSEEHYSLKQPLFLWEGADGTSVKTYRVGGTGGTYFENEKLREYCEHLQEQPHDLMMLFGVTDHGGAPTKEHIREIKELSEAYPISMGRVDGFFAKQNPDERFEGELTVNFIGPYSNEVQVKKHNRMAEYALLNAEKACVIAEHLIGRTYPAQEIEKGWQDAMFNQFHDILGGACIKDAFFDARNLHGRVLQNMSEQLHYTLQAVTNKIAMPGKNPDNAWNLVVWNFNPYPVDAYVEAEVQWAWEFDWYRDGIVLVDEQGKEIEAQVIRELCVVPGFRSRFVFRTRFDGLGYRSFIVKQTKKPVKIADDSLKTLENKRFALSIDETGCVLFDKKKKVADALFRPYVVYDECDTWGFNKTVWNEEKQYLTLRSSRILESGPVRTTMKTVWEFQKSVVELYYTLYEDCIDCRYRCLWNEERCALKLEVCPAGGVKQVTAASPYGFVKREACQWERPMGEWISVASENATLDVAADSVFSYDFYQGSVGLTLLRNCVYGDLRTEPLDLTRDFSYMGQGVTEGKLRLYPEKQEDIACKAAAFNNPPTVLVESNHDGVFGPADTFATCDNIAVQMTVVKKQEEGEGLVLRLVNTTVLEQDAAVTLFGQEISCSFQPKEIKTILVNDGKITETNLLEE